MAIDTIAASACSRGIGTLLTTLATEGIRVGYAEFKKLNSQTEIRKITKKMGIVRKVKTILNLEQEIDLAEFYYPTSVLIPLKGFDDLEKLPSTPNARQLKRKVINSLEDFGADRILVQGTVGQGKSIFLRYLCANEMVNGNRLPIFLELRKIPRGTSVLDAITETVKVYGFDFSKEVIEHLMQFGFVSLFLDGFDEVSDQHKERILSQIEDLCLKHEKLVAVITSRPERGIEGSSVFRVRRLASLVRDEYKKVIPRYISDEKKSEQIILGIEKSRIAQVLSTPLMIALLVVRFKIEESIPENEVAFFDDLFLVLVQRHDNYKAYRRDRKAKKLGDHRLRRVFCGICYLSKSATGNYSHAQVCGWIETALAIMQIGDAKVDDVLEDIVKISNLLLEEGNEYRFVHTSVQEYHAAAFIKEQSVENAKRFYETIRTNGAAKKWLEELRYLNTIDSLRMTKFAIEPALTDFIRQFKTLEIVTRNDLLPHLWMAPPLRFTNDDKEGASRVIGYSTAGNWLYHDFPLINVRTKLPIEGLGHIFGDNKNIQNWMDSAFKGVPKGEWKKWIAIAEKKHAKCVAFLKADEASIDVFDVSNPNT